MIDRIRTTVARVSLACIVLMLMALLRIFRVPAFVCENCQSGAHEKCVGPLYCDCRHRR